MNTLGPLGACSAPEQIAMNPVGLGRWENRDQKHWRLEKQGLSENALGLTFIRESVPSSMGDMGGIW